jgi:hypothetical protein
MDEPALQGCLIKCRLIGVIEGEQGEGKKKERYDRLVAIEENNHKLAFIKHINDLGKKFIEEVEKFFVNYHDMSGKKYPCSTLRGPRKRRDASSSVCLGKINEEEFDSTSQVKLHGRCAYSALLQDAPMLKLMLFRFLIAARL